MVLRSVRIVAPGRRRGEMGNYCRAVSEWRENKTDLVPLHIPQRFLNVNSHKMRSCKQFHAVL